MSVLVKGLICLCYYIVILFIRRKVLNLLGDYRVGRIRLVKLPVGSLNKAVLIYPCIGSK